MRARFRAFLFALSLSSTIALAAAQAPGRVPLDVLLDRAAWYLDAFVDEFENVVAEERYIQDSSVQLPSFSPVAGGRGAVSAQTSPSEMLRARHWPTDRCVASIEHSSLRLRVFAPAIMYIRSRDQEWFLGKNLLPF